MKNIFKPTILPVFTLISSAIGLLLRLWLFSAGMDEKGLLITAHPANALIFILFALVMAVLFLCIRSLSPVGKYSRLFPASIVSAIGCSAASVGVLISGFLEYGQNNDIITLLTLILAVLAAGAFLLAARCRQKGTRPHFLLYTVITAYLMLHLVSQYRLWSPEPQLQIYFFPLMASVFLMLTGYHATVLTCQKGSRRWYVFCNQAAVFCCCLCLNSESWLFYLSMALWAGTGLCSLRTGKPLSGPKEA